MWDKVGDVIQPLVRGVNIALAPLKPTYRDVRLPAAEGTPGGTAMPPTPIPVIEALLRHLDNKKLVWVALAPKKKAELLRRTLISTRKVCKEAAELGVLAKGSYGDGCGEELNAWVPVIWGIRQYIEALEAEGQPKPNGIRQRDDGQYVVQAFPRGLEALFFGGIRGEVWIESGKLPTQGRIYREDAGGKHAEVSLVLGAGNQISVVCTDILYKLVVEGSVVICKMNPVNEYLGPIIRRAFAPLVEAGFVEVVYGGGDVGKHLVEHKSVRSIHLTGSAATFDAIVWGPDNIKKEGAPKVKKPVAAELGCVTPYIVVPGNWTAKDMDYYAEEIVAGLVHNAGHNCLKGEILVTDAEWPQRAQFVEAVRRRLSLTPRRVAWYPGSEQRAAAFLKTFPSAEKLGRSVPPEAGPVPPAYMPWLFQTGLTPIEAELTTENWCGVLQEVALPGCNGDPKTFMEAATRFANDRCWGTLSCCIFIHPKVQKDSVQAFDSMVADLKYGSVCVNLSNIFGFTVPALTWGAYPGNPLQDIGSGNCAVHNTLLLDYPEKSVLKAPWRYYPVHTWSARNRNLESIGKALISFFSSPSIPKVVPTALATLRG